MKCIPIAVPTLFSNGFDISIMKKFKRIKGDIGAKFMVKRLKRETRFIKINNLKSFKDFDKVSDFRT